MAARVIVLVSGGTDSALAAALLESQGLRVQRLHFVTGFAREDHRRGLPPDAESHEVGREYFREVVLAPRFGYGAGMNPCLDCRIFMLRRAARVAAERGVEVVATGEVPGKRSRSQSQAALGLVERESGLEGRLLRPLSARLLPPTEAERDGRIDRARLGRAHSRSRREQLRIAAALGAAPLPATAGGCCRLADRAFARRLRDLIEHRDAPPGSDELALLRLGRHFRLSWSARAVVARDEREGLAMVPLVGGRWTARVVGGRGPLVLVDAEATDADLSLAAALAVRYSRWRDRGGVEVRLARGALKTVLRVDDAATTAARARRL